MKDILWGSVYTMDGNFVASLLRSVFLVLLCGECGGQWGRFPLTMESTLTSLAN